MSLPENSEPPLQEGQLRLQRRVASVSSRLLYSSAAFVAIALVFLFWWQSRPHKYTLRMTAGDRLGRRYKIAEVLAREAKKQGIAIQFVETTGSAEALEQISRGQLDIALVQGGIGSAPHLQEVAVVAPEPLHLLVKRELATAVQKDGLRVLCGKRINLSTQGSGTRRVALKILNFVEMEPGKDFLDEDISYSDLEKRAYIHLPDALFTISLIPSSVVEYLVRKHGFVLVPIPFAEAVSLRYPNLHKTVIPAFAYGVVPAPTPPTEVTTLDTHLLLVARDSVSPDVVKQLLEVAFDGDFARDATLPEFSEARFLATPEMPIHRGAIAYRDRNDPVITSDFVQGLEDAKSLILSVIVAGFFVYRWWRQRRYNGFDSYLHEVTRVERKALLQEAKAIPNVTELMRLRNELGELKTAALEKYTHGELRGEELMAAFLTHVADVRGFLSALILAERGRLADLSRDTISDVDQNEQFRKRWEESQY